jgi:hypothetical protein
MVKLKSLVLNIIATLFFTAAFFLLFMGIILFFLPVDFREFKAKAEQELPARVVETGIVNEQLEQSLGLNSMTDEEFQLLLQQLILQCQTGEGAPEGVCQDLLAGNVQTREDLKRSFGEHSLGPQIRDSIKSGFDGMEEWISSSQQFILPIAVLILISLVIGILFIAWESWEYQDFPHSLAGYFWGFSFFNFISLVILWFTLSSLNEWLAEQVSNTLIGSFSNQGLTGLQLKELVDIVVGFFLQQVRPFLVKPLIIYGALSLVSFVATKLTKAHKHEKPEEEKKPEKPKEDVKKDELGKK